MAKPIREIDELLRHPGFEGTPASPRQLEWLLHRSCSLGLPAPLTLGAAEDAEWDRDDLGEFTDHVTWTAVPYGRTIVVRGEAEGAEIQRHVCILSVGRMTDLEIPPGVPWIQRTDQLPFPVEWSARVTIEDAGRVGLAMRRNIQRIRSQKEHYEHEHAEPAPGGLDRQASKALVVEDELSSGLSGLSTRTAGWYRIAVSGATQEEALDRATGVRQLFAPQVTISRPADQYAVARELIPGEKLGRTAYKRRMPVTTMAAAVPTATAKVGDRVGIHLGETSGTSSRVVTWEPWSATEQAEESGLAVICAGLGGGKSTAGGNIIYRTVMQSVSWTVLDPSGRLTALCQLPQLDAVSKAVDLLDAAPGALCAYRVIAEPRREHFFSEVEWRVAQANAHATRRLLASSVLRSVRPRQMQDHVLTEVALMRAVGEVSAATTSSLSDVVTALGRVDGDPERQRHAATCTTSSPKLPGPAMGDCSSRRGIGTTTTPTSRCSRRTPRGGTFSDDKAKGSEDLDERLSMCVLYLAAWLAQRAMYMGDRHARKGIFIDEAWALSTFTTGRRFIERAGRDSRKHNTRVLMASQNPSDLLRLDLANLVSAAFIGRHGREGAGGRAAVHPRHPAGTGVRGDLRVTVASDGDGSPRAPRVRVQRRRGRRRTDPHGPVRSPRGSRGSRHHR